MTHKWLNDKKTKDYIIRQLIFYAHRYNIEGVSMYLQEEELKNCLIKITSKFEEVAYMVDCYTPFAAKMSKLKNPIKSVGVSQVYGIKDEFVLEEGEVVLRGLEVSVNRHFGVGDL